MDLDEAVEAVFHAANERLRARFEQLSLDGSVPFICECGNPNCFMLIELSKDDYEGMKVHRNSFVLVPGHASANETLVKRTERFELVEKADSPQTSRID